MSSGQLSGIQPILATFIEYFVMIVISFFFFNDAATTEIYTLSLHDALPICARHHGVAAVRALRASRKRVPVLRDRDRKSTRLNSSHVEISYAVFCLKKKIIRKKWHLGAFYNDATP